MILNKRFSVAVMAVAVLAMNFAAPVYFGSGNVGATTSRALNPSCLSNSGSVRFDGFVNADGSAVKGYCGTAVKGVGTKHIIFTATRSAGAATWRISFSARKVNADGSETVEFTRSARLAQSSSNPRFHNSDQTVDCTNMNQTVFLFDTTWNSKPAKLQVAITKNWFNMGSYVSARVYYDQCPNVNGGPLILWHHGGLATSTKPIVINP